LRDFQSVFSAIDQRIVSGIEIYSGGFPAAYGDALSGLTVIEQREPTELRQELGLSLLYTSALSSGTFRDGRSQWLVSVRRGNVDHLLNSELGEPTYGDAFLHLATALGSKHRLAVNWIGFDDDVLLRQGDGPGNHEEGRSETDSAQAWLKVDSDWNDALSSRTLLHATRFTAERHGVVDDAAELFAVADDVRRMHGSGVKQDWDWEISSRQWVSFGFEAEQLDGSYRYVSAAEQRGVLATLGPPPPPRDHALAPSGESYGAYASDRVRITDRWVADLGVRWDRQTYLPPADDEQFSPRASVLYRLGAQSDLRVSYGRFFQAEGLLDLQVEDGVLAFAPAQSATHSIVGVEHRFDNELALRVEVFRKWTESARPRYENLFDPLELLPELRPGRVQVSPDRADARGLEVFVSGNRPVAWWANYSFAKVEDVIDGARVPRSWDQRHALGAGVSWDVGPWTLNAAATLHSGWPATLLSLETAPGPGGAPTTIAVAGDRNVARLDHMRRLDFRASKDFAPKLGSLRFFAELTNVTGRENPCCLGYEPVTLPDGSEGLEGEQRHGLPLTLNVGLLWEF
jgi:TonB-dependent receptor-like protein